MYLVDTHAHLDFDAFDADRDQVIARAREAGLVAIVNPGTDLETSRHAVALATATPGVSAAVGIHPHSAASCDVAALRAMVTDRVVAIGEIGLDYFRDLSPRGVQRAAFEAQVALAADLGLPVIVHCRDAWEDTVAVLRAAAPRPAGVFHCFSGDAAQAGVAVGLGFHVSFAGPVTYPRNDALRAATRAVPADRLLVETDAPYLAPQAVRGKRCESAHVAHTLFDVARARGEDPAETAALTLANARRLFGLPVGDRL